MRRTLSDLLAADQWPQALIAANSDDEYATHANGMTCIVLLQDVLARPQQIEDVYLAALTGRGDDITVGLCPLAISATGG